MKNLLALKVPGYEKELTPPSGIPDAGAGTLEKIISLGITLFLIVVVIAALAYLIWGGIRWTTSGGDASKVDTARQQITFAIIGLIVAFLAFAIIGAIGFFFGINLFRLTTG